MMVTLYLVFALDLGFSTNESVSVFFVRSIFTSNLAPLDLCLRLGFRYEYGCCGKRGMEKKPKLCRQKSTPTTTHNGRR